MLYEPKRECDATRYARADFDSVDDRSSGQFIGGAALMRNKEGTMVDARGRLPMARAANQTYDSRNGRCFR